MNLTRNKLNYVCQQIVYHSILLKCLFFELILKYFQDIFHKLLGAFHSAHALILQEGGLLTTLCVAVAVQLKGSTTWVLCVCNVGDSLCFVYNPESGVQEVCKEVQT